MPRLDPASLTTLTFDCYGTLIDWEAGTIEALRPLLVSHGVALSDNEIIAAAQEIEEPLCQPPYQTYREVLGGVVEGFGRRFGFPVRENQRSLLASSIPSWHPFPDTVEVLKALASRFRLAIISNIDDDLFAETARKLEVRFEHIVTAQQTRCYKPHRPIFEEALRRLAVEPSQIAHVAEGITEVPTARQLGCSTVWVRRNGRSAHLLIESPDLEVADLRTLQIQLGIPASGTSSHVGAVLHAHKGN
ncbi:MAG: haloacid dehalogenase type II [Sinobacteraceae bacterium]|nr:haloacid dehalogenase type II [Nevskiaceae bacterium]